MFESLKKSVSTTVNPTEQNVGLTPIEPIQKKTVTTSSLDLLQELSTFYSEGDTESVIKSLRNHLNDNKGNVDYKVWYMLLDCYQVLNKRDEFEKVALSFANKFGTSPPSWFDTDNNQKQSNITIGKNALTLDSVLTVDKTKKFADFFEVAKKEKFARINVSTCKFDKSEASAITILYKLFTSLRKNKIHAVLMGDNNLINFCKTYIEPDLKNKTLVQQHIANEQTYWLLYLEILQWKGLNEDFETLGLEFAMKFDLSPPGWETSGIMTFQTNTDPEIIEESSTSSLNIDLVITQNNIETLIESAKTILNDNKTLILDFSNVERIEFSAAGSLAHFLQEAGTDKTISINSPNEMILALLEMIGANEFAKIITRKRS